MRADRPPLPSSQAPDRYAGHSEKGDTLTPPTGNPAYALRNILQSVINTGAETVLKGWETVLLTNAGSLEFGERHGEVVGLYSRVYQRLLALPGDVDGRVRSAAPGSRRSG
jgi:hypothetical protein